ncbi:TPA: signal peptidase II [Candidatus Poribacteria bacterium]|nr:signal peptidase II [Candidatus Poribacteria bacterium]
MRRAYLLLAIAIPITALDQVIKWMVQSNLRLWESKPIIPGLLYLSHVINKGAAFGIMRGLSWLLIPISILAIVFIFLYYKAYRSDVWMRISLGFLLGGALGNLIDRVRLGYVVDFIDFRWWPSFNLADASVFIGAVLLACRLGKRRDVDA